jgi:hypothetical protein
MPAAGLTEAGYVQTILDTIAEFERSAEGQTLRTKLILSVSLLPMHPPFSLPTDRKGNDNPQH